MPTNIVVRARINEGLKVEAAAVLASIGLSVSDAIRLMLMRVVAEKAMPFEVRVPNAATAAAMASARRGEGVKSFKTVDELMADLNADD